MHAKNLAQVSVKQIDFFFLHSARTHSTFRTLCNNLIKKPSQQSLKSKTDFETALPQFVNF